MRRLVVAVSREFGSGGRLLGERIAQELDLRFYDRALIAIAARESGFAPEAFEDAEAEGHAAAKRSFHLANEAEKVHGGLYKKALEGLEALKGKDADWYLCPICGFVHEGSAPDVCPICKAKGSVFVKNPVC